MNGLINYYKRNYTSFCQLSKIGGGKIAEKTNTYWVKKPSYIKVLHSAKQVILVKIVDVL